MICSQFAGKMQLKCNRDKNRSIKIFRTSSYTPLFSSYDVQIIQTKIQTIFNSCVVIFSRNSCVVFWQFFAKVGITANESIDDLSKKQKQNHGDLEV